MPETRRGFLKESAVGMVAARLSAGSPDTARRTPIVDCHAHAGTAPALTDPWTATADPTEILRRNKEAGIDQTVIFPISNKTFEAANREIAAICKRYPGKFIGFAKHDQVTENGRIRDMLRFECRELGLRGLKLHEHPGPEILDTVAELGIPILYHPERIELVNKIADDYPGVDFILAHLGSDLSMDWMEHLAGIGMAQRHPNVYLETGTTVITRYLEKAVQELPAEKLLFGTDEPEVDCRLEIFKIRVLKLPPKSEELILGGNILRLLSKYRGDRA
jgi:predicted TIM-barrel fold metal-dependent hydrolase